MRLRRRTWFAFLAAFLVIGMVAWSAWAVQKRLAGQQHEFHLADLPPFLTEELALATAREAMTRDGLDPAGWSLRPRAATTAPDGRRDQFLERSPANPNRGSVRFNDGQGRDRFVSVELDGNRLVCTSTWGK